jgi:uroporphyrinogen III methyltransferase/synthase
VDALRLRGAEPIEAPMIRIAPPRDRDSLRRAMREASRGAYDWVVFTSGNAVRYAVEALAGSGWAGFDAGSARIAAVGRRTARELAEYGFAVDVVADPSTAEGLVAELIERGIAAKRILYPRGDLARDAIPVGAEAGGSGGRRR